MPAGDVEDTESLLLIKAQQESEASAQAEAISKAKADSEAAALVQQIEQAELDRLLSETRAAQESEEELMMMRALEASLQR